MKHTYAFETQQIHAGHHPDRETFSRALPIYQTSSYIFKDVEHAANLFDLNESGNIYTRIQNPTTSVFEERMAVLEGGIGALAVSSGHAAQFIALQTLLETGDHFVCSPYLYGGTYNQFKVSFKKLGIHARIAKTDQVKDIENEMDSFTKLIFIETIGNPGFSIPDFEKIAKLAKKYDIPLVVDNTFGAAGYVFRPIEHGANIVVESATKWIGGHGTSIGGVIIDAGNYPWDNGKFPGLTEPSEGYHGLRYNRKFGEMAFIVKARVETLRDFGPCLSPFNAFLLTQGLETLSLRMDRHLSNAIKLAEWFKEQDEIEKVSYPGLEDDPHKPLADKYMKRGAGAVLSIELKGGSPAAKSLVENLKLVSHLANIGDAKSLIIQPSLTTHRQLSQEEQSKAGVSPGMLRISVGLESIDDIIYDFKQAIQSITY